jgi:S1-C subfamily serine protease
MGATPFQGLVVAALASLVLLHDAIAQASTPPMTFPEETGLPQRERGGQQLIDAVAAGTDDLPSQAVADRIGQVRADGPSRTRGPREIAVYAKASPSVVLVLTPDGIGSGTILGQDGLILTNWHVIGSRKEVGIALKPPVEGAKPGRTSFMRARVIKVDQVADLALVQLISPPADLPSIPLGAMSQIQVGADVHAIGHPTGETWTYTRGLVSQIRKGYEWTTESQLKHRADVIQTQTPINPGNSGGPLLSDDATLLGVNSFKSEGEALNFAVSVDEVKRFLASPGDRVAARLATPNNKGSASGGGDSCKPKVIFEGRNKKDDANLTVYDLYCTGKATADLSIPDDVTKPVILRIDKNSDGKPDIVVVDENRDGRWDFSLHDTNFDGKWDLVGRHPDGKPVASSFEPYRG